MERCLPPSWLDSPLNGQWMLDDEDRGITAGVSLRDSTASDEQMELLNGEIDDGDLSNGMFRKLTNDRYTMIIER